MNITDTYNVQKLIKAYDKYIELLNDEMNSLNVEAGEMLRDKIAELKLKIDG